MSVSNWEIRGYCGPRTQHSDQICPFLPS